MSMPIVTLTKPLRLMREHGNAFGLCLLRCSLYSAAEMKVGNRLNFYTVEMDSGAFGFEKKKFCLKGKFTAVTIAYRHWTIRNVDSMYRYRQGRPVAAKAV